jgi:two-component system cell cycle response regulator
MILPDTPLTEALVVAERVVTSVEACFQREQVNGEFVRLTCSGGIATLTPETPRSWNLLSEADRALYDAKRAGGNRIVWRRQ